MIPAPLTIIGFIATVFIVRDKRANPDTSRFFANMIAMASLLETVGLLSLCGLTGEYGITPSFYLSLLSVCFLYGMNLFFQLIYQKSMKEDSAFKYWEQEYEHSTLGVVMVGLIFNFKAYRMFYSRYQNKEQFNAVFQDDETFYRATIFTSVFSILFVTLPLLVASVFSFFYIPLWYQLKMFCVECVIIELTLLVCMSFDIYRLRKKMKGAKVLTSTPADLAR